MSYLEFVEVPLGALREDLGVVYLRGGILRLALCCLDVGMRVV